jgi:hypothetical protein
LNTNNLRFEKVLGRRYISDLNKYGELNDWSVCFMSTKGGTKVTMSNGATFYLYKRSTLDSDITGQDSVTLKSLVPPADELIDLADVIDFKSTSLPGLKKEVFDGSGNTDTWIRRYKRPKERGLVLVYPIESRFEFPDGTTKVIGTDGVLFGVSIVFPSSANDVGFRAYIENETI